MTAFLFLVPAISVIVALGAVAMSVIDRRYVTFLEDSNRKAHEGWRDAIEGWRDANERNVGLIDKAYGTDYVGYPWPTYEDVKP